MQQRQLNLRRIGVSAGWSLSGCFQRCKMGRQLSGGEAIHGCASELRHGSFVDYLTSAGSGINDYMYL